MSRLRNGTVVGELSNREQQVTRLLATGLTYVGIGEALDIGFETVKSHVDNVRRKLRVRSRTEIAIWWTQHGRRQ